VEAQMNNVNYGSIIDGLINEKVVLQSEIESLRALLQHWEMQKENIIGKRVCLISTTDPYTNVSPNDLGIVDRVDDAGTIFVNWDNGSKLGLIPGIDFFEVIF